LDGCWNGIDDGGSGIVTILTAKENALRLGAGGSA